MRIPQAGDPFFEMSGGKHWTGDNALITDSNDRERRWRSYFDCVPADSDSLAALLGSSEYYRKSQHLIRTTLVPSAHY